MAQLLWPAFEDGQLGLNRQTVLDQRPPGGAGGIRHEDVPRAAWNVGQKLGLSGRASLLPLLRIWPIGAAALLLIGLISPAPAPDRDLRRSGD